MTVRHCEEAVFFYSYQSWPLFDQLHSNCKLPLTPACLTTCCCLATFPFSDVKQTVFALLPGNWTDTFIDIYIYITVKCGRTEINTTKEMSENVVQPGIEPGSPDYRSDALTTRPLNQPRML